MSHELTAMNFFTDLATSVANFVLEIDLRLDVKSVTWTYKL